MFRERGHGVPRKDSVLYERKDLRHVYAILSQNLVLKRFTRLLKGFHIAFYKSPPALGKISTKVSLLLKDFQQKVSLLSLSFERALGELLESLLS